MFGSRLIRVWLRVGFDRGSVSTFARSPAQKVRAVTLATEQRQKTFAPTEQKFAQAPKGRRAVMRSPQAKQSEESTPVLTELVTAEAIASPNER
jgi:hypothetical protein